MTAYKPTTLQFMGVKPKKRLSQNFLIDQNILEKITQAANIQQDDTVIEIGPGAGALTEHLLKKGATVFAIEKDVALAEKLIQKKHPNLNIYMADALDFSLDQIPCRQKYKIVANLPYHITTPLITRYVQEHEKIKSLTVTVQKEYGNRMVAKTQTPDYSHLTLFLSAYANTRYCFTVKPTSFYPKPSVDSCVMHLALKPPPFTHNPEEFFFFTRTAFGKKRKMLRSSLREIAPSQSIEEALLELGLKKEARPQELSLQKFIAFFEKITKAQGKKRPPLA